MKKITLTAATTISPADVSPYDDHIIAGIDRCGNIVIVEADEYISPEDGRPLPKFSLIILNGTNTRKNSYGSKPFSEIITWIKVCPNGLFVFDNPNEFFTWAAESTCTQKALQDLADQAQELNMGY